MLVVEGSGGQVMKGHRFRLEEDLVPGVRPADANQDVVLVRQVRRDVPLALASELSTDDHIDQPPWAAAIEAELAGDAHDDVLGPVPVRVDHDIGDFGQSTDVPFCRALSDLGVGGELPQLAPSARVPLREHLRWGIEVNVDHDPPEGGSDLLCLLDGPHGVDNNHRVFWERRDLLEQCFHYPTATASLIEALASLLKGTAGHLRTHQGSDPLPGLQAVEPEPFDELLTERCLAGYNGTGQQDDSTSHVAPPERWLQLARQQLQRLLRRLLEVRSRRIIHVDGDARRAERHVEQLLDD